MLLLLSPLLLHHHDVAMATVVAWGAVPQSLAVLAQVSRVYEGHHILVPGQGSRALIGGARQRAVDAVSRGAPNGEADSDRRPVIAVLLHLTVVDAAVRKLGSPNEDAALDHHQLVTCYHLRNTVCLR